MKERIKKTKEVIAKVAEKITDEIIKEQNGRKEQLRTKFRLEKVIMEHSEWSMVIIPHDLPKKIYLRYILTFLPNEEGFDESVAHERAAMDEIHIDPQVPMFNEERQAQIDRHQQRINDIESNRTDFLRNNKRVESIGVVAEMKNKTASTLTFKIPNTLIEFLNEKRYNIADNYLLILSTEETI